MPINHRGRDRKYKQLLIAHEQSKLIIGKEYSVAHAIIIHTNGSIHNVPINPFKHKDPQLGANFYHYHIDGRFAMDAWTRYYFSIKNGITNFAVTLSSSHYKLVDIIFKKKRCVRLTTGVNPPPMFFESKNSEWYQTMKGKSCAGRKCPHFGTVMIELNGILVCPLHNLKGDIIREIII